MSAVVLITTDFTRLCRKQEAVRLAVAKVRHRAKTTEAVEQQKNATTTWNWLPR